MDIWNRIKKNYLFIVSVILLLTGLGIWVMINKKESNEGFSVVKSELDFLAGETSGEVTIRLLNKEELISLGKEKSTNDDTNKYIISEDYEYCPHKLSDFRELKVDENGKELEDNTNGAFYRTNIILKKIENEVMPKNSVLKVLKIKNKYYLKQGSFFLQAYYPRHNSVIDSEGKLDTIPILNFGTKSYKHACSVSFEKIKDFYGIKLNQDELIMQPLDGKKSKKSNIPSVKDMSIGKCCTLNNDACSNKFKCNRVIGGMSQEWERLCVVSHENALLFKIEKYIPPVQPESIEPKVIPEVVETQENNTPDIPILETNSDTNIEGFANLLGYNSSSAPNGSTKLTEGFAPLKYNKIYY